jgi:hypothetical protein
MLIGLRLASEYASTVRHRQASASFQYDIVKTRSWTESGVRSESWNEPHLLFADFAELVQFAFLAAPERYADFEDKVRHP